MFTALSFEDAVKLFKQWGFVVEPGPLFDEVSLIIDEPDHRTYCVYKAEILPQIAAVALRVRWQNGALAHMDEEPHRQQDISPRDFISSPAVWHF